MTEDLRHTVAVELHAVARQLDQIALRLLTVASQPRPGIDHDAVRAAAVQLLADVFQPDSQPIGHAVCEATWTSNVPCRTRTPASGPHACCHRHVPGAADPHWHSCLCGESTTRVTVQSGETP